MLPRVERGLDVLLRKKEDLNVTSTARGLVIKTSLRLSTCKELLRIDVFLRKEGPVSPLDITWPPLCPQGFKYQVDPAQVSLTL